MDRPSRSRSTTGFRRPAQPQRMALERPAFRANRRSHRKLTAKSVRMARRGLVRLDRTPTRWSGNAPSLCRLAYDDEFLHVALNVLAGSLRRLEIEQQPRQAAAAGRSWPSPASRPAAGVIYVVRGYPGGSLESIGEAGAPAADAERLAAGLKFAAKPYGKARRLAGGIGRALARFSAKNRNRVAQNTPSTDGLSQPRRCLAAAPLGKDACRVLAARPGPARSS